MAEVDEELMKETKLLIMEYLSAAIDEGQSAEEISNIIEKINSNLNKAENLLNSTITSSN